MWFMPFKPSTESGHRRIHLHFDHSIQAVDWDKGTAVFSTAQGPTGPVKYDLLVAADGRYSKTRRLYEQHEPRFKTFLQPSAVEYVGFSGLTLPGELLCSHKS